MYKRQKINHERTSLERIDDVNYDVNSLRTQINTVTNSANQILGIEKKHRKKDWFYNLYSDAPY